MKAQSLAKRFWSKVKFAGPNDCWLWMGSTINSGYGRLGSGGRGGKTITAHKTCWRLERGVIPRGYFVLHRCDNKLCVNPDHLWLGTHKDNMADMAAKGRARQRRGESAHGAKLTDRQVAEIRGAAGLHREIAARYGVAASTVGNLKALRYRA